jgi:energy-coupling factor transporter ATP-binding protein EcfA2
MSNNTSLHANPFLASFQLLAWLLFHPSAWRAYVSSIDPDLPPDFALAKIATQSWQHPQLRRLGYIALVQSLQVGVLIGIVLSLLGIAGYIAGYTLLKNPLPDVVFGVTVGISLCLIGGLVGSFTISLPFGWIAGVLGGLSVGILLGIGITGGDVWGIVGGFLALSAGGSVTANLSPQILYEKTLGWRIGSFIIGILVGMVVLMIVLGGGSYLLGYILPQELGIDNKHLPIIGMAVSVGVTLGWFLKDWRLALRLGILLGGIIAWLLIINNDLLAMLQENTVPRRFLSGSTMGILYGISFTTMFALPYLIARHIATVWAGVVAGFLGTGAVFFAVILFTPPEPETANNQTYLLITWSMVAFMLGLGQQWWLSVLSYPFESAWNLLLYRKMERHPERAVELLHRHSAFWNEHQQFRLLGLDKMLVMAYEYDPVATEEVIVQLSHSHQSWAVEASQIEADTQRLVACTTTKEIADVHHKLMASNELTGPDDEWLDSFVETSREVEKALARLSSYQQHAALERVINGLHNFLIGSKNTKKDTIDVQRFRNIASKWKQILTEYAEKLLTTQSLPNPYVVAIPLNEAHYDNIFQKRTEVGHQIERLVSNPYCPPLLLYGQRRIGKTSLLKNLGRILPPQIIRVFIDGQESFKPVHSYVSFFYRLGRAMSNAMSNAMPPVPDVPSLTEETLQTDPFMRFDEWLDQVEQVLGNRSLLLALDEFVVLEEEFTQGRLERAAVLGKFRSIIQHRPRFRLLFSGTHTFAELQHWANYFINVQTIHLSYLTEEEARKLIAEPMADFPLRYLPAASQRVMTLTRCHPAFVQMMCSHIVQLKDRQAVDERLLVQVQEVEATVADVLKTSQFLFAEIEHNQVDAKGREILRWIAAAGEGVAVSKSRLQMQFPEALEKTLALLLQRELIEEVEGGYRFQVELVRRWFVLPG